MRATIVEILYLDGVSEQSDGGDTHGGGDDNLGDIKEESVDGLPRFESGEDMLTACGPSLDDVDLLSFLVEQDG